MKIVGIDSLNPSLCWNRIT
uniref:Uncharacterized protein n=1 Tax=Arundo donax TaxID=35708 RepID=A0A0A9DVJ7_ARUDO